MPVETRKYDEITITLKCGNELNLFLEKKDSKKIAGDLFDRLAGLSTGIKKEAEENGPTFFRLDGWKHTPLIVSVIHLVKTEEIASISVIDAPKFLWATEGHEELVVNG